VDLEQLVRPGEGEHPPDGAVLERGDRHPAAVGRQLAVRADQGPQAGRVAELGGREVDQDAPGARAAGRVDPDAEARRGGEVELAPHRDHVNGAFVVLADLEGVAGRGGSHA
jgi:hypothetical protein